MSEPETSLPVTPKRGIDAWSALIAQVVAMLVYGLAYLLSRDDDEKYPIQLLMMSTIASTVFAAWSGWLAVRAIRTGTKNWLPIGVLALAIFEFNLPFIDEFIPGNIEWAQEILTPFQFIAWGLFETELSNIVGSCGLPVFIPFLSLGIPIAIWLAKKWVRWVEGRQIRRGGTAWNDSYRRKGLFSATVVEMMLLSVTVLPAALFLECLNGRFSIVAVVNPFDPGPKHVYVPRRPRNWRERFTQDIPNLYRDFVESVLASVPRNSPCSVWRHQILIQGRLSEARLRTRIYEPITQGELSDPRFSSSPQSMSLAPFVGLQVAYPYAAGEIAYESLCGEPKLRKLREDAPWVLAQFGTPKQISEILSRDTNSSRDLLRIAYPDVRWRDALWRLYEKSNDEALRDEALGKYLWTIDPAQLSQMLIRAYRDGEWGLFQSLSRHLEATGFANETKYRLLMESNAKANLVGAIVCGEISLSDNEWAPRLISRLVELLHHSDYRVRGHSVFALGCSFEKGVRYGGFDIADPPALSDSVARELDGVCKHNEAVAMKWLQDRRSVIAAKSEAK